MRDFLETHPLSLLLIPAVVAFCAVCWIHPRLVRLALRKNIVDNPDSRKLQRMPVPVLGGTAVFFGLCLGLGCLSPFFDCARLFPVFTLMALMLYTGTLDDIMGLSPRLRFAIEILAILLLVLVSHHAINDFHGLWGVHSIPMWAATLLTVFASVGIINAINLIDGVNGLSSGYCVLACSVFSIYFYMLGDLTMTVLGLVCIGALVPFFIHNVFGDASRMFIGDGGTLVMGLVMSVFVTRVLEGSSGGGRFAEAGMGLIPFTLSVLSIPVFDTLRVMGSRIWRGRSPFRPDKTHLHHLFIDTGFSHPGTTFDALPAGCFFRTPAVCGGAAGPVVHLRAVCGREAPSEEEPRLPLPAPVGRPVPRGAEGPLLPHSASGGQSLRVSRLHAAKIGFCRDCEIATFPYGGKK